MMGNVKEINLIYIEKNDTYKKIVPVALSFIGVLFAAFLFVFVYFIPQSKINSAFLENIKLTEEINSAGDIAERITQANSLETELLGKKEAINAIDSEKTNAIDFLNKLSAFIPENVTISSFSMNGPDSYNISFTTTNPMDTMKLVVKLREMDIFESVDISSIPLTIKESTFNFNLKLKSSSKPQEEKKSTLPSALPQVTLPQVTQPPDNLKLGEVSKVKETTKE